MSLTGYTPHFPPCPYCGGKVTGASMNQEFDPTPLYAQEFSSKVIGPVPLSYWLLEPCNHKVFDYKVTVTKDKTKAEPQGGHALTVSSSWYEDGHDAQPMPKGWPFHHKQPKEVVDAGTVVGDLTEWLPGLYAVLKCPGRGMCACGCGLVAGGDGGPCGYENTLQNVIVHLNDGHRWTREQIADWLETLDVDLTFPTEKPAPKPVAGWETKPAAEILKEIQAAKQKILDQGHEGSSVGYAMQGQSHAIAMVDEIQKLYMAAMEADPWPGAALSNHHPQHVTFNIVKSPPCQDESKAVGKKHHELPQNPIKKALDLKASQSSHWAKFTDPTKTKKKGN